MVGVTAHAIWGDLEQAPKFAIEPVQVPQVHRWATEQAEPGLRRLSGLKEEEKEVGLHPGENGGEHRE